MICLLFDCSFVLHVFPIISVRKQWLIFLSCKFIVYFVSEILPEFDYIVLQLCFSGSSRTVDSWQLFWVEPGVLDCQFPEFIFFNIRAKLTW